MKAGKFHASLNESIDYLKAINLFKERGLKNIGDHSPQSKMIARNNNHSQIHKSAVENLDWEIILQDNSLYQFSYNNESDIRYCFIQNPNVFVDKIDYLRSFFEDDEVNEDYDSLVETIREEDFEQFQIEQGFNSEAHIVRYDYSFMGYKKLVHSASHLHIGFSKSLRLPINVVLTPLEFVFFTVRHSYSDFWEKSFNEIPDFEKKLKSEKKCCSSIHKGYWDATEEYDLFFG